MMNSMEKIERYRGCLLGLAVGDALGTTLEFKPPGSFTHITGMIGGGPFNLKPGQWTDDTSMALCLAESLIECRGFNPQDQMERYVRWWKEGHLSSTGTCFDIGNTTRTALSSFLKTGNPISGPSDSYSAGNGSLMRLAPVPLFYADKPREAIEKSGESSKTTHGAPAAVDACRYFGALIVGALNDEDKETILSDHYCPVYGYWEERPLIAEIAEIAAGSFKYKIPPQIRGSGYVVQSLEAALWAFYHSNSFEEGCLMAVNLGDDADTTGAIYGQIAGAYYGDKAIPVSWRDKISGCDLIFQMTEKLAGCFNTKGVRMMSTIEFKNAFYIKLGRGGEYEPDSIKTGKLRIGWSQQTIEDINAGNWKLIERQLRNELQDKPPGVATRDLNGLKIIAGSNPGDIWISFHGAKLWWTRLIDGPVKQDSMSKFRETQQWSDKAVNGRLLVLNDLPGKISQLQGFRGTVCRVQHADLLKRTLNEILSPLATDIKKHRSDLAQSLAKAIKELNWKDFETLVDLVFRNAGFIRVSVLGLNAKAYDLELREPLTEERYVVQVKSQAKLADLLATADNFFADDYRLVYFVVHSPAADLKEDPDIPDHVKIIRPQRLAELALDAGLVKWLEDKVS